MRLTAINRIVGVAALLLMAALVSGCATTVRAPAAQAVFDALDQPYTLDTGDRLRVIVFGQTELSNLYTVDQAGNLSVPLIGTVAVRGLTTQESEGKIAAALRNGFLKSPQVTVEVETYRPFFVLGEVTQPGQYPYVLGMTAQTAVAIARGFTPRARTTTVEITRAVNGELVRAEVPIHQPLRPGDTVQVFERWF